MINGVLTIADLQAITAYERVGDIRRCLERQGIAFFEGKDGVWTTIGLVEAAKREQVAGAHVAYSPEIL